jgi:hypothetical protein
VLRIKKPPSTVIGSFTAIELHPFEILNVLVNVELAGFGHPGIAESVCVIVTGHNEEPVVLGVPPMSAGVSWAAGVPQGTDIGAEVNVGRL